MKAEVLKADLEAAEKELKAMQDSFEIVVDSKEAGEELNLLNSDEGSLELLQRYEQVWTVSPLLHELLSVKGSVDQNFFVDAGLNTTRRFLQSSVFNPYWVTKCMPQKQQTHTDVRLLTARLAENESTSA